MKRKEIIKMMLEEIDDDRTIDLIYYFVKSGFDEERKSKADG